MDRHWSFCDRQPSDGKTLTPDGHGLRHECPKPSPILPVGSATLTGSCAAFEDAETRDKCGARKLPPMLAVQFLAVCNLKRSADLRRRKRLATFAVRFIGQTSFAQPVDQVRKIIRIGKRV